MDRRVTRLGEGDGLQQKPRHTLTLVPDVDEASVVQGDRACERH